MKKIISGNSSKGGRKFAERLKMDQVFRERISLLRRKCAGTEWIKRASLEGLKVQKIKREKDYKKIKNSLDKKLKTSSGFSCIARLCGFIAGDGSIKRRRDGNGFDHYDIAFYPDNLSMAKTFINTFEKIYCKKPSIVPLNNFYSVRVSSKIACDHLLGISTFDTHNWRVPDFVFSNVSYQSEFLRAIFDCESHVSKNNIQFQSVNPDGINQLRGLLANFEIDSKIYRYQRKNSRWNINYILVIGKKESIKKYAELIGFNHSAKINRLSILAGVPERLMGQSRKLVSEKIPRFES